MTKDQNMLQQTQAGALLQETQLELLRGDRLAAEAIGGRS